MPKATKTVKKRKTKSIKISHIRKPEDLTNAQWQIALRKQIAGDENFTIKKQDEGLVYGDYTL